VTRPTEQFTYTGALQAASLGRTIFDAERAAASRARFDPEAGWCPLSVQGETKKDTLRVGRNDRWFRGHVICLAVFIDFLRNGFPPKKASALTLGISDSVKLNGDCPELVVVEFGEHVSLSVNLLDLSCGVDKQLKLLPSRHRHYMELS
jgi:hypothetical protein